MKPAFFLLSAIMLSACGAADPASDNAAPQPDQTAEVALDVSDTSPTEPVEVAQAVETSEEPATTESAEQSATYNPLRDPSGITELVWDDLMPLGEDEVLAALYETYYSNLRQDIADRSRPSQGSPANAEGEGEFDISALISEGAANDTMEQIGTFNVVEELNGLDIRLPGYVVPLDFSSDGIYSEFLLVPYFGACLHTPPPPPNQIVYVTASSGAKVSSIYEPVWIEGRMKTGKFETDTGDSAYEVTLSSIEAYEY